MKKKKPKTEDVPNKHPIDLTPEEINSLTITELGEMRDKSLKLLEEGLDKLAKKKKKEDFYVKDAMEIISKTCLGLHRRIEVLESAVHELVSDKAWENMNESPEKEDIN